MTDRDQDPSWEAVYRDARPDELPWFSATIDPDEDATLGRLRVGPAEGPVLDIGTGPGTFAIELARRGFHVTALDVSPSAIRMARQRAGAYAAHIEWIAADLVACDWPNRFQLVHDRGVYHSLGAQDRRRYVDLVPGWLRPGGHLLLKTFHPDEPGDWGPNRIAERELRDGLGRVLRIHELAPSTFPGTLGHAPKAWRAVFSDPRGKALKPQP